jgi:hypothetical protein
MAGPSNAASAVPCSASLCCALWRPPVCVAFSFFFFAINEGVAAGGGRPKGEGSGFFLDGYESLPEIFI